MNERELRRSEPMSQENVVVSARPTANRKGFWNQLNLTAYCRRRGRSTGRSVGDRCLPAKYSMYCRDISGNAAGRRQILPHGADIYDYRVGAQHAAWRRFQSGNRPWAGEARIPFDAVVGEYYQIRPGQRIALRVV